MLYVKIDMYICMSILNLQAKKPPCLSFYLSEKDGRRTTWDRCCYHTLQVAK